MFDIQRHGASLALAAVLGVAAAAPARAESVH